MAHKLATATLCLSALAFSSDASADTPSPDPDPWFGPDKALHFGAGAGLSAGGYAIGIIGLDNRWAALAIGSGVALTLGAAKEGLDAAGLGVPSWRDFVWSAVGTAIGIGFSITFDAALRGP